MPYFRMLLPDGSVYAEKNLDDGKAAHQWAAAERGKKAGMYGYKLEQWDGKSWNFYESSELHEGTTPGYVFGQGPTEPPSGWTDDQPDLSPGREES